MLLIAGVREGEGRLQRHVAWRQRRDDFQDQRDSTRRSTTRSSTTARCAANPGGSYSFSS